MNEALAGDEPCPSATGRPRYFSGTLYRQSDAIPKAESDAIALPLAGISHFPFKAMMVSTTAAVRL
jgi:hypothetical protein